MTDMKNHLATMQTKAMQTQHLLAAIDALGSEHGVARIEMTAAALSLARELNAGLDVVALPDMPDA